MNEKRSKIVLLEACVAMAMVLGLVTLAVPALAESLSVSGHDAFYGDSGNGDVDILTVTGSRGDTVFINMSRGSEVIASHMAFTLDDANAQADENGDMVGLVSVSFNGGAFSSYETYGIEVYAGREETPEQLLYKGEVYSLFAQYGNDVAEPKPIAVRTVDKNKGEESRPFTAPETLDYNGITYVLSDDKPHDVNGNQTYLYKESADAPESVTAHVQYYDIAKQDGDPIKTEEFTLAKGATQNVEIEGVIASDQDGALYRTLQLANKVTLSYPGTTEYAIMCKRLSDDWGSVGSFFRATINYTDSEGVNLGVVDKVIVNKPYIYTAPTNIYVDDNGTVRAYTLKSREDGVLRLEPGMAEGDTEFDIVYEPIADDAQRNWTVVLENGTLDPMDDDRVIERITYHGVPGETVKHETSPTIKVGKDDYVPYAAAQDTYEHTFSAAEMGVEQVIYYVPGDYVAPEAYDFTVDFVNIATNEVITTQTHTASPSMRSDLEITSPETFTANGVDWVRLAGQESPIRHGFYSRARKYTVYYRDVNDDLHATTVIRTVRVEYLDDEGNTVTRPTTVVDNGTTNNGTTAAEPATNEVVEEIVEQGAPSATGGTVTPGESGGTTGGTTGGGTGGGTGGTGATDTGLQTGEDLRAIDGEDGNTLVNPEGEDLEEMRIDDDETPLAGPGESGTNERGGVSATAIGIGTAAAVAVGGLLFFVFKRRKQGNNGSSNDDATA